LDQNNYRKLKHNNNVAKSFNIWATSLNILDDYFSNLFFQIYI